MAIAAAARAHLEPRSLDLKRSLMLRATGIALCCFLVAAALAVYGTIGMSVRTTRPPPTRDGANYAWPRAVKWLMDDNSILSAERGAPGLK